MLYLINLVPAKEITLAVSFCRWIFQYDRKSYFLKVPIISFYISLTYFSTFLRLVPLLFWASE